MLGGGGELVTLVLGADAPGRAWTRRCAATSPAHWPFVEVQCYDGRPAALPAAGGSGMTTNGHHRWPRRRGLGGGRRPRRSPTFDMHTAGDLIYHFPRRYDERGEHTDIASLEVGEQVTVLAQVQRADRPRRCGRAGATCWRSPSATAPADADAHLLQPGGGASGSCGPAGGGCSPARSPSSGASASSTARSTMLLGRDAARQPGDRGVRRRADPGLPGRRRRCDLADRQHASGCVLDTVRAAGRPAAGRRCGPSRKLIGPGHRAARDPPADVGAEMLRPAKRG